MFLIQIDDRQSAYCHLVDLDFVRFNLPLIFEYRKLGKEQADILGIQRVHGILVGLFVKSKSLVTLGIQ
jgi:hypothetical protein